MATPHDEATANATGITGMLAEHTGQDYRFVGRFHGGETGAFEVLGPDGRSLVLKGNHRREQWAHRRHAVGLTDRLRSEAGWPVPEQWVIEIDDEAVGTPCQVILQERLPGTPIVQVTHALVDELLGLHERRRHLAVPTDPDTFGDDLILTLVEGGQGYCIHQSLREHDDRTRRYVERVEAVGRSLAPGDLAGDDIVHWDLHPGNVLQQAGAVSGVIDSEYAKVGDAGFDLVTLAVSVHDHPTDDGVIDRLRILADAVDEPARTAYRAHLGLRLIDWSIRSGRTSDVDRWLGLLPL